MTLGYLALKVCPPPKQAHICEHGESEGNLNGGISVRPPRGQPPPEIPFGGSNEGHRPVMLFDDQSLQGQQKESVPQISPSGLERENTW